MASTASTTDQNEYSLVAYVRIASLAIAIYDYLETSPTAWKFYKVQWQERRATLGISTILFFLIRITSILVLSISNIGFFGNFALESCRPYFLLAPAFKVVQGMVSHLILAVRAYNVSQRSKTVGYSMAVLYVFVVALQWIATMGHRQVKVDSEHHSCKAESVSTTGTIFSAWIYYVLAIIFDATATVITIYFCLQQIKQRKHRSDWLSRVVRIMLRDGLGYLVVLTLANALNAFFFFSQQKSLQNAFASVGYTVTWIMSQRLIIHIYWASIQKRSDQIMTSTGNGLLTVTHALTTNRSIANAVRSEHIRKDGDFSDLTVPELSLDTVDPRISTETRDPRNVQSNVEVRVERTVRITAPKRIRYELEDYSRPSTSRRDGTQ